MRTNVRGHGTLLLVAALFAAGAVLMGTLTETAGAYAARPAAPAPLATADRSVPSRPVTATRTGPDPDRTSPAPARPVWPAAGSITTALATGRAVQLGNLPVRATLEEAAPLRLRAASLGEQAAARLGRGTGLALTLQRADGERSAAPVRISMDYSRFREAFGGDYASRLRLVQLPGTCADQPGDPACARGTELPATNDLAAGTLSARVEASDQVSVLTLASSASGSSGDYRATDLNLAERWISGGPSGHFTYSYPIEVPAPPYGDAPDLALAYDSGSVDGRTASKNSQASWVGMGWNLGVGFIEREYKSCVDDGHPTWADLCWDSPYSGDVSAAAYVISIDGHATELIKAADGSYRMRDDQSYKIEHLTGGPNGDNDGEYWIVTTLDGTRYFFGYGQDRTRSTGNATNSNWRVPVLSGSSGEPCAPRMCVQTYRWNLDSIQDRNDNYTAFYYATESNAYHSAFDGTDHSYDSGGYLTKIEYGKTGSVDANPPAYVAFSHVPRCVERTTVDDPDLTPPAACPSISASPSSYPDVPADLVCKQSCTKTSPSFFLTNLLDSVTTYVRNAADTGYDAVAKYQLKYSFPATSDGSPSLWLDYVRRIGYLGGTIREAVTAFDGTDLDNRVDYNASLGVGPMPKRRLVAIRNELGGETMVTYGHSPGHACPTGGSAASDWSAWYARVNGHWDTSAFECFPSYVTNGSSAGWGVFHKYVVTQVRDLDLVGGQPDQLSTYTYLGDPAWHHDDDMMVPPARQSWGDWRGYADVRVAEGTGPNTERTVTTTSYFRGMYQDLLVDGSTRTTAATDYDGNSYPDHHFLTGLPFQERRYRLEADGSTFTELASERWVYSDSGITADGPGLHDAHRAREAQHRSRDRLDGGAWRVAETDHTYDSVGLEATESALGDLGLATDDTCTTTTYARNTDSGRWMIDYPETVEEHGGGCAGPVISRTVTLYDGATSVDDTVDKPIAGNPTEVRSYVDDGTFGAVRHTYDGQGRELSKTDELGNRTDTTYTPTTGYPTGGIAVKNPLGQVTTTWDSPAFGLTTKAADPSGRVTEQDYDALGRLTAAWLPTEPRSGGTPSYSFAYSTPYSGIATPTGPTVVTSKQLQSGSGGGAVWLTSYEYLDGLARTIETQVPSPQAGGRAVTVTHYDGRGLEALGSQPMYNASAAGSGLLNPAEPAIPQYTRTAYDALEQVATEITMASGAELWRTTTSDHGDHTVVVPPRGGQVVTWTDVSDKPTRVQAYLDATNHDDTKYTYTPKEEPSTVTDPNGNVTTYGYDWQGHRTSAPAPDSGSTATGYDLAGNVTSATDGRGAKVSTEYDAVGREKARWQGEVGTGVKLAEWTYDTVPGAIGELASATSYDGGQAYRVDVTGYDARGRATGRRWTIPAAEGALAGTYQFSYGYDGADHRISTGYPAAGGLPAETVTGGYTSLGLPSTLAGLATYVTATAYSGALQLRSRTYGSSVERRYDYEATTNRLSSIQTLVAGTAVQDDGYGYDPTGNVTTIVDRAAGQSQCFGYDGRNRLITAYTTTAASCTGTADGGGPDPYSLSYGYDATGSITSVTRDGVGRTYTYPAQGAGSVRPHAVSAVGADTYGYDAAGNMTSRTVGGVSSTLAWDAQDRLASVTTGSSTSSYVYDADGNRLLRHDPAGTTLFMDGTELLLMNGGVMGARYYESDGATVAERTAWGLTWLAADQQGSEQVGVDASTNAASRQRYLPFGAPRGAATLPTDRGFLGKVQDSASTLVDLGARFYDASIGKFISPDPEDNSDDPRVANPYAYAADNPTTLSDPTGLRPADCDASCMRAFARSQVKLWAHYHPPRSHRTAHHASPRCEPRHCALVQAAAHRAHIRHAQAGVQKRSRGIRVRAALLRAHRIPTPHPGESPRPPSCGSHCPLLPNWLRATGHWLGRHPAVAMCLIVGLGAAVTAAINGGNHYAVAGSFLIGCATGALSTTVHY